MNKPEFEQKSLIIIILIGYVFNLIFGWIGILFDHGTTPQLLLFQIGNACAISASVMAARYTGLRSQQVAASAFILLGITHGISLGALSNAGINADREASMVMPMIPALIFMFWCNLFPKWLRWIAIFPIVLFALVYVDFHSGESPIGMTLYAGYGVLQVIELLWALYLYKDWKAMTHT